VVVTVGVVTVGVVVVVGIVVVVMDGAPVDGSGVFSVEIGRLHGRPCVTISIAFFTVTRWGIVHLSDCPKPLIIHSLVFNTTLEIKEH
jgi:hypothetical protein